MPAVVVELSRQAAFKDLVFTLGSAGQRKSILDRLRSNPLRADLSFEEIAAPTWTAAAEPELDSGSPGPRPP
jgi:hypothetical protein